MEGRGVPSSIFRRRRRRRRKEDRKMMGTFGTGDGRRGEEQTKG